MSEIGAIDIEGKQLVFSSKDIDKLTTPDGCQLQIVTDKVHKLYDDDDDDDDDGGCGDGNNSDIDDMFDNEHKEDPELDKKLREDRMRREFISLVLNANRDPIKPGTKTRFKEYREDVMDGEFECDTRNLENSHIGIHRMYENMGKFDDYMAKNNFQEISPGRVYKLKRVSGVQLPVTNVDLVMYNCALWTENSKEPFDSTWLRRTTITTHLATDSILPGLHELLATCSKGELCEAFIRPEAAFGRLGVMPRIPPNATIFCLLEVVKVVTRDKYDAIVLHSNEGDRGLVFEDLYQASDEARRRGNYFYEQGQYRTALQRYKSAIRLLEGSTYKDKAEESKAHDLLIKLYNNCARTANAIGNPRLALAACKQARMISDMDPKTHWHRMTAWDKKGHPDRALGVVRRAMQLFEHDANIVRTFQKAADDLKIKIQKGQIELDDLHRLMGRALLSSA